MAAMASVACLYSCKPSGDPQINSNLQDSFLVAENPPATPGALITPYREKYTLATTITGDANGDGRADILWVFDKKEQNLSDTTQQILEDEVLDTRRTAVLLLNIGPDAYSNAFSTDKLIPSKEFSRKPGLASFENIAVSNGAIRFTVTEDGHPASVQRKITYQFTADGQGDWLLSKVIVTFLNGKEKPEQYVLMPAQFGERKLRSFDVNEFSPQQYIDNSYNAFFLR